MVAALKIALATHLVGTPERGHISQGLGCHVGRSQTHGLWQQQHGTTTTPTQSTNKKWLVVDGADSQSINSFVGKASQRQHVCVCTYSSMYVGMYVCTR